jgi:Sec-independent protein secretion pathway component TatC
MYKQNFEVIILELRWRLMYFLLSFSLFFTVCILFKEKISFLFLKSILIYMNTHRFIFHNLLDILWFYIKICLFFSFIIYLYLFIIYFYLFIKRALVKIEHEILITFIIIMFTGLLISSILVFKVILVLLSKFFIEFENTSYLYELHWEASLNNLVTLYIFIWSGISAFLQAPSIIYLLNVYKKIKITRLLNNRKIFLLLLLFITAIILNTDFISQLIVCLFIYIIYELYILFFFILKNLFKNS